MPLMMKDTGLVQGVPLEGTPQASYKVVKGFYDEQNQERRKGEIVQLSERFAKTLLMQGRIEPYAEHTAPPEPPKAPERQAPSSAPEPAHHEEEEHEESEDDPVEESEEEEETKHKTTRKKGGSKRR